MSIIDKIRKLRALATSPNLNEATAAARAAERLLQEHELSEAEIEAHADPADAEIACEADHAYAAWGKMVPAWENILSSFLARHYQCKSIEKWDGDRRVAILYGRPSDVETVRYQWAFFRAEIVRLACALGAGQGRTWRVSFCRGAARAIIDALKETKQQARIGATASALAIVDERLEKADALMREKHPNVRTVTVRGRVGSGAGYDAGKRAGAGINQRSALGAGGTRLLGK